MRSALAGPCAAALLLLVPLAGADMLDHIENPTKVPEFGFPSLGGAVEPGASGLYGFDLRNRYNGTMVNVTLTIEIYLFATVEEARNLSGVAQPPVFSRTRGLAATVLVASLPPNATVSVREEVTAGERSPEGVYFTRHLLEFDYTNFTDEIAGVPYTAHFVMKSRGYFTAEEFASVNYSDLGSSLAPLGVQGIVPDSSVSVRRGTPLWPLAAVAGAAAATGALSVAGFLTDAYPGRFPRVARALLLLSGRARVGEALARAWLREKVRGGRAR